MSDLIRLKFINNELKHIKRNKKITYVLFMLVFPIFLHFCFGMLYSVIYYIITLPSLIDFYKHFNEQNMALNSIKLRELSKEEPIKG